MDDVADEAAVGTDADSLIADVAVTAGLAIDAGPDLATGSEAAAMDERD
jgi:hypothetical protein